MISNDGFLSALSFGGDGHSSPDVRLTSAHRNRAHGGGGGGGDNTGSPSPVREVSGLLSYAGATTPTLYTALSASPAYASDYPSAAAYASWAASATPAPHHQYAYGQWAAAAAAESHVYAAATEAERQRQILEVERTLAEEQRRRLESRMTVTEVSRSPSREPGCHDTAEEARGLSVEGLPPPPSSPSPPSAYAEARRGRPHATSQTRGTAAEEEAPQHREGSGRPSPSPEADVRGAAAAVPGLRRSPSYSASPPRPSYGANNPTWSTAPSPPPAERDREDGDTADTADTEPSPSPVRAHATSEGRSSPRRAAPSPPPHPVGGRPHRRRTPPRHPSALRGDAEEERLYEALQRKLDRIQQALRPSTSGELHPLAPRASARALSAYGRRLPLTTPPWPRTVSSVPPLSASPPLTRRAPSADVYVEEVEPLSRYRQPRRLRWDLAHSGNVVVSADASACRADASDALALIEREYDGRLDEVLRRLVIPFYAVGHVGVTRGVLLFAFRWVSPATAAATAARRQRRRQPHHGVGVVSSVLEAVAESGRASPTSALAFGFATRDFAGYGTQAPAFLYLSTGVVSQGLRTSAASGGAERPYAAPYAPGLELAARLDTVQGELEFFVEGVSMGVAFRLCPARHPAPLFPVVVFSTESDAAELVHSE
ncbi:hypothetical protein NESM_000096600 [Novymonas esmeraldas]|uniref:Uncharacterized protein n=1 Tax=Novymonas esmeraldas TaxID=1808958 RepID=A0AAW0F1Y9_9TRYP